MKGSVQSSKMAANNSQGVHIVSLHNLETESNITGALPDNRGLIDNHHASAFSDNNAGDLPVNTDLTDNDSASAPSDNIAGAMPGITGLTDNGDVSNTAHFSSDGFPDVKLSGKMKIPETQWNDLKQLPAVQSCLSIFEDERKVAYALQIIKGEDGKIPEDITGYRIARTIMEMEGKKEEENSPGAFLADIHVVDKGHQDGKAHEVEIHLMCGKCDAQGVKPVLKLVQGPTFL